MVAGTVSGSIGLFNQAIGSGTIKNATVLLEVDIVVNSSGVTSQEHLLPFLGIMGLEFAASGEFNGGISVERTSQADFGARIRVGKEVLIPSGNINAVLVNSSGISEGSGFSYLIASGLIVTVSGSYSGIKPVHNASIDFSEGINAYSGGLTVTSGNFSASHIYSYPGKYVLTTRVQDVDGSVNMERFHLNFASGLITTDLGVISGSAVPEEGLITSESYLPVLFSVSGTSGVSLNSPTDARLWWRFYNNGLSQSISPSANYSQPGNYVPIAIYKYASPSGELYLVDSNELGFNF